MLALVACVSPNAFAGPARTSIHRAVHLSLSSISAPYLHQSITSRRVTPLCSEKTAETLLSSRAKGERGAALALSYTTISVVWYLCGMSLIILGFGSGGSSAAAGTSSTARNAVIRKLAAAWAATFAASQVTTPWRAAGAVAISPFIDR